MSALRESQSSPNRTISTLWTSDYQQIFSTNAFRCRSECRIRSIGIRVKTPTSHHIITATRPTSATAGLYHSESRLNSVSWSLKESKPQVRAAKVSNNAFKRLPDNRTQALRNQICVCRREMFASEESAISTQRRRMRSL